MGAYGSGARFMLETAVKTRNLPLAEWALAVVELLIAAGVDPAAQNKDGKTAADWARRRGMLAVAARLERAASGLTS